jgi:acetyl esterase/lipase
MRLAAGLLLLVLTSAARAEEKKTFQVETRKDVAYRTGDDADPVRHKLDLYLPKGAKDFPVLFFIHGGGWRAGKKDGFNAHGKMFASHGIGFVAINYRLSPAVKHPEHIKDVAAAFAWVVGNLGKDGADLKRIFVSGHSAGGHLAALLASDGSYLKAHKRSLGDIKGCIPVSGVFDVNSPRMAAVFGDVDSRKGASPMTHVSGKLPPFLIFYADKELGFLGKQAEEFGKAVKAAKGSVVVKMIDDRDHGTIMRNIAKPDDPVTTAIFAFIRDPQGK